ncbi:hypothetical protein C8F01DRAFT_1149862 [Mycena amicta]|nr:hypothetical protein C8F01DRAFT_1149862 [Mycena amicta]
MLSVKYLLLAFASLAVAAVPRVEFPTKNVVNPPVNVKHLPRGVELPAKNVLNVRDITEVKGIIADAPPAPVHQQVDVNPREVPNVFEKLKMIKHNKRGTPSLPKRDAPVSLPVKLPVDLPKRDAPVSLPVKLPVSLPKRDATSDVVGLLADPMGDDKSDYAAHTPSALEDIDPMLPGTPAAANEQQSGNRKVKDVYVDGFSQDSDEQLVHANDEWENGKDIKNVDAAGNLVTSNTENNEPREECSGDAKQN